ncbi:MAG TPA: hypothetical protein VF594_08125 [Rubricoccaceae bacterium]|jgi:hypothetical protein
MLRSSVLVALVALAAVPTTEAQVSRRPTRRIVSRPWGAPAAPPAAQPSDARAAAAPVEAQTSEATPAPAPAPVAAPAASPAVASETATVQVVGQAGLRVTLPPGWSGAGAVDESRLPAYALYTFANTARGALAGVTLRVERVVGLNPAEEQGWRSGQARVGYHGARPVGPIGAPVEALVAVETAGAGTGGATAFVQRGRTFWAVSVQAPAAMWAARREAIVALMASVSLPADDAASASGHIRRTPTARR